MARTPKILALVVAAGEGSRAGGCLPKQYRNINGKPLLRTSVEVLLAHPAIAGVAVVIAPEHQSYYMEATKGLKLLPPATGGKERQDSVKAGLQTLAAAQPDYVLIHDAARPFLSAALLDRIVGALKPGRGVVPALPMADTVRRLNGNAWQEVPREGLMRIQTPQAFPYQELLKLHQKNKATATDDAALWLAASLPLDYVEGDERLRKVTTADDIAWAAAAARGRIATGFGYDVHRLVDGSAILLGGVSIPHDKKLEGHSDADVVLHALVDAILGALAEGDIGKLFPPSDAKWKGADSKIFVEEAVRRVAARGGNILHADLTIICEAPKISPHREAMQIHVAGLLDIAPERVGVKATTTEGLGFTGKGEGIAAHAVVTLSLPS